MKPILAFFILLAASAIAFSQDDTKAAATMDTFGDALTKSKLNVADDLIGDSATVYWVDKKLYGKKAILKYLKAQVNATDKHEYSFNPDDGIEDENISTTWGTFAINYGSGDQVSNQMLGRYTMIAKKIDDKWQIVSLHLSVSRFGD